MQQTINRLNEHKLSSTKERVGKRYEENMRRHVNMEKRRDSRTTSFWNSLATGN